MPIGAPVAKTAKPDVFMIDYPVKPGDTRIDLTYQVPYTEGAAYDGKITTKDDNTYLIVPNGVTLVGESLERSRAGAQDAGASFRIHRQCVPHPDDRLRSGRAG